MKKPDEGFDVNDPANVAPFIVWLASEESKDVTGRVWEVFGGTITVFDGYRREQSVDIGRRWDAGEVEPAVRELLSRAKPLVKVYGT